MAKRLTDTEKWKDEWFLSLSNDCRIIWQYLIDMCSHSGIIRKNFKLLNFCCNTNITEKDLIDFLGDRIVKIGEYYFIPGFLKFQYPQGLNSDKPVILSVRKELFLFGLDEFVRQRLGNDYLIIKSKSKDKSKDKDKGSWKCFVCDEVMAETERAAHMDAHLKSTDRRAA